MKKAAIAGIVSMLISVSAHASEIAVPASQAQITLSFAPIVKKASPAVVNIYTKRTERVQLSPFMNDPVFGQFFGGGIGGMPRERVVQSLGSGVIVNPDGTVVTSYHVVKDSDQITIILSTKAEYEAKVEKIDPQSDLAVLKIHGGKGDFPSLKLRDSDTLEVGDLVLAIGNPFGVGQTVTQGIVSALARAAVGVSDYQFFIQTDAAINPGNSGGALVDGNGDLVGINTAIYSTSGGSNGIGFAIPANMVKAVLSGKTASDQDKAVVRPWLGMTASPVTAEMANSLGFDVPTGLIVNDVYEDSPAARAGLQVGDVIVSFAGKDITSLQDLNFRIATSSIGTPVEMKIVRGGKPVTLSVTLTPQDAGSDKLKTVVLKGKHPLRELEVADITPQLADAAGLASSTKGVIVVKNGRSSGGMFGMGLRMGDIILEVNGVKVTSAKQLQGMMTDKADGWKITFQRGPMTMTMVVRG